MRIAIIMFPKLLKLITNNFPIKLIAILISFGLWAYVASGESKVGDFPGSIPVEIKNPSAGLMAISDVKEVKIRLVAEGAAWKKMSSDAFTAYIDVIGLGEGTHEIPVKVISSISNVQIVEINPAQALVRLSPVVVKKVPVKISLKGEPAEGLTGIADTPEPNEVEIEGPKNIVDATKEINGEVKLKGEDKDFVAYVQLEFPLLRITPSEIKVKILVGKGEQSKTIGVKVKTKGNPASGFWISNIKTDPSELIIKGNKEQLESIGAVETKEIDIEGLSENKSFTASLVLPAGINMDDGENQSVTVQIELSPLNLNKEVGAALTYKNLSGSLKVKTVNPANVKAVVSGASAKLAELKEGDIKLNLDLNGRSAGVYNFDLSKDNFSVPSGIEIISFLPSAITVELENK